MSGPLARRLIVTPKTEKAAREIGFLLEALYRAYPD